MSTIPNRDNLTEEQLKALDEAAMLVINAREQGATILRQAGIDDTPDDHFGSHCQMVLSPHHPCGCRNYTGPGPICLTMVGDRRCGHRPHQHVWS